MFEIALNPGADAAVLSWLSQIREHYVNQPVKQLRIALGYAEHFADDIIHNANHTDDPYVSCGMCGGEFEPH